MKKKESKQISMKPDKRTVDTIILQQSNKVDKTKTHFVILKDGVIVKGIDTTKIAKHCEGHNTNTIGITLEGDSYNIAQQKALMNMLYSCMEKKELIVTGYDTFYPGEVNPNLNIRSLLGKYKQNYG